jgi:hypothetical protein
MATNAIMVVLFQYDAQIRTLPPLRVLAFGALLYAVGSAAWRWGVPVRHQHGDFDHGRLLLVPGNGPGRDLAPPEMRGRYMGLFDHVVHWLRHRAGD